MKNNGAGTKLFASTVAGMASTGLMKGMQLLTQKQAPQLNPPLKQDPGVFMVDKAEDLLSRKSRRKIPRQAEAAAAQLLGFGYGLTFSWLYAALPGKRRLLLDGTGLGLLTWAAGYLGWLPATGLMPPIWEQKPKQVVPAVLSHVLFGIATVAGYTFLKTKLQRRAEKRAAHEEIVNEETF
jgi:hypothetical protein